MPKSDLAEIMRLYTRNADTNVLVRGISIHGGKQEKVFFLRNQELLRCVYTMDERFLRNEDVNKVIRWLVDNCSNRECDFSYSSIQYLDNGWRS